MFSFLILLFRSQTRFNTVAAVIEAVDEPDGFAKDGNRQDKVAGETSKLCPY